MLDIPGGIVLKRRQFQIAAVLHMRQTQAVCTLSWTYKRIVWPVKRRKLADCSASHASSWNQMKPSSCLGLAEFGASSSTACNTQLSDAKESA